MSFSNIELPSNRKFGLFFTVVFFLAATYSYYINAIGWLYILSAICLAFFTTTIFKADALYPLNKLWMRFGFLLGMIISPIVIGVIFFGIFTPLAILMRLFRRDELRLNFKKQTSHWVNREPLTETHSFDNQY